METITCTNCFTENGYGLDNDNVCCKNCGSFLSVPDQTRAAEPSWGERICKPCGHTTILDRCVQCGRPTNCKQCDDTGRVVYIEDDSDSHSGPQYKLIPDKCDACQTAPAQQSVQADVCPACKGQGYTVAGGMPYKKGCDVCEAKLDAYAAGRVRNSRDANSV